MRSVDKAWMAAIIENRGKIHFTNDPGRRTNQLVLRVTTKKMPVIERLASLTGTKPHRNEARTITTERRGCTEHCHEAHVHTVAEIPEIGVWAISGVGAAIVVDNLRPYFLDDAGIEVLVSNVLGALPTAGQGRYAVDATIVRLRRLGWHIPSVALEHFVGLPKRRGTDGRFLQPAAPKHAG